MTWRARRTDFIAALALLALSTLLFADVLLAGANFYFRDLYLYHMPLKRIFAETVWRGELPLWNPMISGGQPMAANPAYEVFYPPQWLLFLGSFERGFALHVVAHVWLALLGMYAMLRAIPLRLAASLFGALSFGLSGLMMGAVANLPTFFVWSWAPLIGLTLLRLVQAPSGRRFAAAAAVAAMPLLVAEPFALLQIWVMAVAVVLAYAPRRLPLVAAVGAASLCVAAVQLVPMIDLLRASSRARGFSYELVTDWSMPLIRPVELLLPRAFGLLTPDAHAFWGAGLWLNRASPYLLSIYAGAAVAILAATGFVARARGARVAGALALLSYLLAVGGHTPLFRVLYALGLRSLRYPEKFAAMGVVALIVFAAVIVDRMEGGDARLRRAAAIVASVILVLMAAWTAGTMLLHFAPLVQRTTIQAALVVLGWTVILAAYARGHRRPALLAGSLLLIADLGVFQSEALQRMPRSFFQPPGMIAALGPAGGVTIFHRGEWTQQDEARRYGRVSTGWFARNALRPFSPSLWGLRTVLEADYDETALLATHDLLDAMRRLGAANVPRWSEPFMMLSNVTHVLDYRSPELALREAGGRPEIWRPVRIRRVPNQGRYWFARAIVPARTQDELVAALQRAGDVRGFAFVPWMPFVPAAGRVVRVRERSNQMALDVETAGRALLVLTVTRDAHWRATIDGAPAPLQPANVAYQALDVPPGTHHIELRYRNPWIAAGAIISAAAVLALLLAGLRRQRLHDHGDPLPSADARRGEAVPGLAPPQLVQDGEHQAGA